LGPTLSGKTSLLRLMAGLDRPTAGEVWFDGKDVTGVPVRRRGVAMVYPQFVNYPSMSVYENIASPLRVAGHPKAEIDREVREAARLLKLEPLLERTPLELSGGQQQRTAIARAIVIKPEILLLDEPLSNLDAKLREDMRTDLLAILDDLAITTILVTHDQAEALSLAHRVAVISAGRVEQIGTPTEIYESPATGFVAGFVGQSNRLKGRVAATSANGTEVEVGGRRLKSVSSRVEAAATGDDVLVFIRAERLRAGRAPMQVDNDLSGKLRHVIYLGSEQRLVIDTAVGTLTVVQPMATGQQPFADGEDIHCGCDAGDVIVIRSQ
jgi:ABC-type sugar transport system ATPase subunit